MTNTNLPAKDTSAYYPSKQELSKMIGAMDTPQLKTAIQPGFIARTDGLPVDEHIDALEAMINKMTEKHPETTKYDLQEWHLQSRMLSVSDLTEKLYERFKANPNAMRNWLSPVSDAVRQSGTEFKLPKTKVHTLPVELAQFIRIPYHQTSEADRQLFNEYIFDVFDLEDGKTYFIKTGQFSSKFQFANAKCYEPREMGDYFIVINNFAMEIGAGQSVDLVVREYIEDAEDNPTIYNGMPLRTEFRAFVDCDEDTVYGVVPYWHPVVMKNALKRGLADSIQADYKTYQAHENKLTREFNEHVSFVRKEIQNILPKLELSGRWSVDVMKNGDDFYIIDLALMDESALTDLI